MRLCLSILLFFVLSMTAACSSGPADSDIRAAVLSEDGSGFMREHFDVTDVERLAQHEQGGAHSLKLRYSLKTLTSSQDFKAAAQKRIAECKQGGLEGMGQALQYGMLYSFLTSKLGEWQPGASLPIEREVRLAKGDKGWAVVE
ncbi:hypothetical protein [Desulfocurvibacter africanus]|uniref:Lipoprotein n=1 Tax=Desulfocurvibacter africanus subsp. africanus str. Walvis Bay TaxID=690850 RepID=F3YVQ3_DESAF|nr:hypothetical protein [Desulfocurvibacter africanus]EGJ48789.1 hypothetical protein Desaf_0434 [Desulfocurvibacter africanus subsp. africanus str. Walvis Bay]